MFDYEATLKHQINELKAERQAIQSQMVELESINNRLLELGCDTPDVMHCWRTLAVKHNEICDQIKFIEDELAALKKAERKLREEQSFQSGLEAYWEAQDNKTYEVNLPDLPKYLQKAFIKGYAEACQTWGHQGQQSFQYKN